MCISPPEKLNVGRLRPFINFAAVCESAVIIIGSAIEGSHGIYAVVAPRTNLPNVYVWLPLYDGVRALSGVISVAIEIAYLWPR